MSETYLSGWMLNSSEHEMCSRPWCKYSLLLFGFLFFFFFRLAPLQWFSVSCGLLRMAFFDINSKTGELASIDPDFSVRNPSTFIVRIRICMCIVHSYKVFSNPKIKFSHKSVAKHRELWTMRKAMDQNEAQSWTMFFKIIHKKLIMEIWNEVANTGNCKQQIVKSKYVSYFNGKKSIDSWMKRKIKLKLK